MVDSETGRPMSIQCPGRPMVARTKLYLLLGWNAMREFAIITYLFASFDARAIHK